MAITRTARRKICARNRWQKNCTKSEPQSYRINRLEILAYARKLCEKNNYDPEIFCGIKERSFKGFKSNNAFKIWDGTHQKSLEDSSGLIQTLMKAEESSFIIYPFEIKNEIKDQISLLKNNFKI